MGTGVLVYMALVSVGAFYLVTRSIPYLISTVPPLAPEAIAIITLTCLAVSGQLFL